MAQDMHYLVDQQDSGVRIDAYLGARDGLPSRSACSRLIEAGAVTLNGDACTSKKYAVQPGDRISVELPEEREPGEVAGEPIPLDIRFEDEYLIVLSKQRGLVCHPAHGHASGTLANALVHHCGIEHLGTVQGEDRPGIVHRLDRDTSGLMLAAKDDDTQRELQNLIRTRTLDRRYITLVHGQIAMDEGTINTGIARSTRDRVKMAVSDDPFARQAITTFRRYITLVHGQIAMDEGTINTGIARSTRDRVKMAVSDDPFARQAITTFRVLERFESSRFDEGYTLVECHLYTGRTHQIRVHMRHIHHPLVGDPLYGKGGEHMNLDLDRQFLHSWSVAFDHPVTGRRIECRDELPWDLAAALDDLHDRSLGRTEAGDAIIPLLGLLEG